MIRNVMGVTMAVTLLAGTVSAQQVLINGTGASFPLPMYSKWFDSYHKKFSNIQINYQSIGSSGGNPSKLQPGRWISAPRDGPMTDEQLKVFQDKNGFGVSAFPDGDGRERPGLQAGGSFAACEFHGGGAGGDFPGPDHQVERSAVDRL